MPEQVKIIQRRLLVLNQRVLENAERKWSAWPGLRIEGKDIRAVQTPGRHRPGGNVDGLQGPRPR